MPSWIKRELLERTQGYGKSQVDQTVGDNARTVVGTVGRTGSDTVTRTGTNQRDGAETRDSAETTVKSATGRDNEHAQKTGIRSSTVTPIDETVTRTAAAHELSGNEATTQNATQTQVEDAGGAVSFKIRLLGGLYNSGSANPPIN